MSAVCDGCQRPAGSCLDTCPKRVRPAKVALVVAVSDAVLSVGAWIAVAVLVVVVLTAPLTAGPAPAPLHHPTPAHTAAVPTPEVSR